MSLRWGAAVCIVLWTLAQRLECAPTQLSKQVFNSVEFSRSNGIPLVLDAAIPAGEGPFPAAIIVHGGAWVSGNRKTNVQPLFKPLTDAGFAWFSIDYTLVKDISQLGAGVQDVEQAVLFVKAHAAEYRIDRRRSR